ncbi:fatty-acid synthase complex protein [Trichosporon asahii var. asahii CBS 2479]|uniref:Fatty-acid synthase complex protein n=1 Tax=Trichosporon asahii var. asahii (strain ATCC 90039 / CBS 2479 / JCM 2466 / KCTC 7840 / NBRC 103889/ NCYC 2677 / UAMH 7654) TaxID=1186058 RepID=J5RDU8_TRIAS|nr:fatty-acid synthase complex protein [Trichosporon asahii var. asahii CBS 2479]EJT52093.1 fatty-acid synthase complex protein [Trichosporon asahii var. asahii CBS 2479]
MSADADYVRRELTSRCIAIMNRADPALIDYMKYHIDNVDVTKGPNYEKAKKFGQILLENCLEVADKPPVYRDVALPTAPHTEVSQKGDIQYSEIPRQHVRKLESYVKEMANGGEVEAQVNLEKAQADIEKLWELVNAQPSITSAQKSAIRNMYSEVIKSLGQQASSAASKDPLERAKGPKARRDSSQFLRPQVEDRTEVDDEHLPFLHLKRKTGTAWAYSNKLTNIYFDVLTEIASSGVTYAKKAALLTGVGKGSIGVEILKGLLSGGATCIVTTSRYSRDTVDYYKNIFHEVGSKGSKLIVVPFNGASKQDVEALVDYIYSDLGVDLDYIVPFAALPENGREIDGLDDRSELAHRLMLTNLLRLLGAVKAKKAARKFVTRPTQVVLPLSPNHGVFGNDGLYAESKISLETLFNRWASESWGEYLCIAGAVIGWTRGTGLMSATNFVAEGLEKLGVRTFSAKEMAFNILGLMHPLLFDITQIEPIWADLNGGMDRVAGLADVMTSIRLDINKIADLRKAIALDNGADFRVTNGADAERLHQKVSIAPRANFNFDFPKIEEDDVLKELNHLQGLIDLDKVIVCTGFAEVGPWGSSRTRWEMEARGEFTIEGCIELAWMMGYIKYLDGKLKDGKAYVGWVDAKSGEPVDDKDVRSKYEKEILEHTGIRLIEPELFHGYDPERKGFTQEVELSHDLEPLEVSADDAAKFKREQGDNVDIWAQESGEWFVKFKKGARVLLPKAVKFDRVVAGQLPTGWDAKRYGLPEDIIAQTDRTALWALVSVMEALIMSGVTDPYEIYKHVHPSEVGTSLGSGMGGMASLSQMFKDRREEKDVQKDILQETFINTVAGWVNLLLMSASGPVKIPVGACATALQSVEIACDSILGGKAKVMIAGGFDDFSEEGSYEFANMKATSNAESEFANGREPNEFSRPMTSTRAGFMESQGCGVHVLMSAKTALEMGASIQGIVAYSSTHTDKAGRSVPAPGRGVLSTAREVNPARALPILDVKYRARQLAFRRNQIAQWMENEIDFVRDELAASGESTDGEAFKERVALIESEAKRQEKDALATFGMLEGSDPSIAPLRRALAVWGLDADSVGVISCHGTSTKANDKNESGVYNLQFEQLGRTKGNAVPVITQKYLTGHPKGGAAAWMFNGMLQTINSALVPGNRNADNISEELLAFPYLFYPSKSIQHTRLEAGLLTSFGFGQVGGQAAILHPRYLYASLEPSQLKEYKEKRRERELDSYTRLSQAFVENNLVQIKDAPPYTPELEGPVLLNPLARATPTAKGSYAFQGKLPSSIPAQHEHAETVKKLLKHQKSTAGVGVDTELISAVPTSETFRMRNFTPDEIMYCSKAPDVDASFAGRWAAKEAVFKALGVPSKGAGAAMKDIEIVASETGPQVRLAGDAAKAAGGKKIEVSISHSDSSAIAFAVAQ